MMVLFVVAICLFVGFVVDLVKKMNTTEDTHEQQEEQQIVSSNQEVIFHYPRQIAVPSLVASRRQKEHTPHAKTMREDIVQWISHVKEYDALQERLRL